jgi:LuxR family maltose regulon positive regulatory protein
MRAISRPRLLAMLDRARPAAVTALVAPAGYGKTTLVADWLGSHATPNVWIALDETDDEPSRLVETILAALAVDGLPGSAQAAPLLDADPPVPPLALAAALARDLAAAAPELVLVLDDLHSLHDAQALEVVRGLIDARAPGVHIVLSSRRDLPWDLRAARASERLVEVRVGDLRIDQDEATAFAWRLDAPPAPALIARALEASSGWPAAFRLMLTAGGANRRVDVEQSIDWLVESACTTLPAVLVERLTAGSVASEITDDLLDALVPASARLPEGRLADAGAALATLLARSYGDAGWIRLHPIVREALERRFVAREGRAAWRRAHEAASDWYARTGATIEAVRHALAAGDDQRAGDLVEAAGLVALNTERWDVLARLIDAVPDAVAAQRPGILVLRCWRNYYRPPSAAHEDTERAVDAVARWPVAAERRRWQANLDVLGTFVLDLTPTATVLLPRTERILEALGEEDDFARGILVATTGFALGILESVDAGCAYLQRALAATPPGRPATAANILGGLAMLLEQTTADAQAADAALEQMLAFGRQASLPGSRLYATIGLGWRALERLDLDRARELFAEAAAIEPGPAINNWRRLRGGQALVALLSGDGAQADSIATDMVRVVETVGHPDFLQHTRSFQARIWLAMYHLDRVRVWARSLVEAQDFAYYVLREAGPLTRLRARAVEAFAETTAAIGFAAEIDRVAKLADDPQAPAWCRDAVGVVQAQWLWHTGAHERAVEVLLPIATRACAQGNLLSLVEAREEMAPMLDACVARGLDAGFARDVSAAIERLDARWPNPLRLSERELEVLALMAQPLSFDEIGERLYVAPVTVRRHAHNIYRRLGVAKRRLAVERAIALGLLTP